tara:strand:- start:486 stop:935 length:450 start_codon:yes stop_codon:yes gene_type:complete
MKRILSLAFLVSAFSFQDLKADSRDMFNFEIDEVNTELAQVEELDQYLDQNENVSFAELQATNSALVANVSDQAMMSPAMAKRHRVLGIPSWIWGCVFGVAGVAIVYFVSENKDETKEALWGCVGASVVGIILYFAVFAAAATSAASTI